MFGCTTAITRAPPMAVSDRSKRSISAVPQRRWPPASAANAAPATKRERREREQSAITARTLRSTSTSERPKAPYTARLWMAAGRAARAFASTPHEKASSPWERAYSTSAQSAGAAQSAACPRREANQERPRPKIAV